MGTALMMEGLLSACYHVCPNYTNFQFGECQPSPSCGPTPPCPAPSLSQGWRRPAADDPWPRRIAAAAQPTPPVADTSFMYMIAGLCMLKLYQKRHPDINASAYSAYACLAVVIFFSVVGVVSAGLICPHGSRGPASPCEHVAGPWSH